MKVLFVTEQYPWPLHDGGNLRTWHILQGLARAHDVWLVAHTPPQGLGEAAALPGVVRTVCVPKPPRWASFPQNARRLGTRNLPLWILKNWSAPLFETAHALANQEQFDAVHFNHLDTACFVLKRDWPGFKVFDTHNCLSAMAAQVAQSGAGWLRRTIYRREARQLAAVERRVCEAMDRCLTCSADDRRAFENLCDQGAFVVAPNGVDTDYFYSPPDTPTEPGAIAFTGAMNYYPNEQAALFFCREVLPRILRAGVAARLYLVGKTPSRKVQTLHDNRTVIVTGRVDDVRPYVAKAEAFVVPLRHGSGTRLKILEAFAMGKAVVSTTLGAEGIEARAEQELLLADDPQSFAKRVVQLLRDRDLQRRLGGAARQLVERRYAWPQIQAIVRDAYENLEEGRLAPHLATDRGAIRLQ